jgi:Flp pilus assembly protein TadB
VISAFVFGTVVWIGTVLIRRAVRPPSLETELQRFSGAIGTRRPLDTGFAARLLIVDERDLAVTGISSARHASERITCAAVAGAIPIAMYVTLRLGGVVVPPMMVIVGCVASSTMGLQLPRLTLARKARTARRDFRSSFSSYLDLVSMMLAGGAGIETALTAASRVGDGPTYSLITDALDVARSTRRSPWDVFSEEGQRIGVDELPELASTIKLGGEQGARMTASLVAKATSLRHRQMAEIEAAANASTERMGLPMVLMFIAFLVLLGFPAVHLIGQGFG